jgi:hypothetical protein
LGEHILISEAQSPSQIKPSTPTCTRNYSAETLSSLIYTFHVPVGCVTAQRLLKEKAKVTLEEL